jgi:hypothetical protein
MSWIPSHPDSDGGNCLRRASDRGRGARNDLSDMPTYVSSRILLYRVRLRAKHSNQRLRVFIKLFDRFRRL